MALVLSFASLKPGANSCFSFIYDSVKVMDAQSLEIIQEIAVKDIIEIDFSPKGTFLSTWMRQSKQNAQEVIKKDLTVRKTDV